MIENLSSVVTPPYDVISPEAQEAYYRAHPYNVVRLILGKHYESDGPYENRYTRAGSYFQEWRRKGILIRDPDPGIYVYTIRYDLENGDRRERTGLIARVKLEDLCTGCIRRHERTFSGTKSDRFKLMLACKANFSPIFCLYTDPKARVTAMLRPGTADAPLIDFTDRDRVRHLLWQVTDPETIGAVREWFVSRPLFIADGHHRYETALAYWEHLQRTEGLPEGHPAQYVMMYLCNTLEDLTILPAHRLLVEWPSPLDKEAFLREAGRIFRVDSYPFGPEDRSRVRSRFLSDLESLGEAFHAFGFCWARDRTYHLLRVARGALEKELEARVEKPLRALDAVVFTEVVLKQILGMEEKDLDNERNLNYTSRFDEALDWVEQGRYSASFLMNPTRIEQVVDVAEAGLIMPRKSTYFFPKVTTGIVINPLE